MPQKPRTKIPNTPFGFIFFAIKPYWKWTLFAIVFVLTNQLFHALQPIVFRGFVDSANSYTANNGSLTVIFLWAILYPVFVLLQTLSTRAASFMFNYLTVYVRTGAVKSLFECLSLHSLSYFNDRFSGALSSRVDTVSKNVSRLVQQFIWSILSLAFSFILSVFIIASTNAELALAFAVGFLILVPINLALTRPQIILSEKVVALGAKLRGQVIDAVTNISTVQQYARRDHEIERLDKVIKNYRDADVKSDNYREKIILINNILAGSFIAGTIFWAFYLWLNQMITVGEFIMIATLTGGFMWALSNVGQNINQIMESYGEIRDGVREIIRPHGIIDKLNAKKLIKAEGNIEFNNVEFYYHDDPRRIFKNLFISAKSGEKIGIVGTSGAGKTTLIKLLLRQHDVTKGKITVGGYNIKDLTQESLREHISVVPQEPILFHRTIRENIVYGKLNANEGEMIEVAKKAQAHEFIKTLPKGYDSLVGERGVKLSVGQRQRIAIARAFLKNAPILVLDEATSALDSESEVAVQKALQNLMEGKTVFAIAHRLSTLREMDRILVFKEGKIVEDGTHRSLLRNKSGTYASLWSHQAGGFLRDEENSEENESR